MGLTIVVNGVGSLACHVDDHRMAPIFALAESHGLLVPHCGALLSGDLDTQLPSPGEVAGLKSELGTLLAARREQLADEKGVRARDSLTRSNLIDRIVADDPLTVTLRELVELCDAALDANTGLMGLGE